MAQGSTAERASASPTTHALVPGRGWVEYGPGEVLQYGPRAKNRCASKQPPANGSWHTLKSPGGNRLNFSWHAAERAWVRHGGIRMAFAAEYLSSHGWTYVGPVEPKD